MHTIINIFHTESDRLKSAADSRTRSLCSNYFDNPLQQVCTETLTTA